MGAGSGWQQTVPVDLAPALQPGDNVLAIAATNATDKASPAGLIGYYEITLDNGQTLVGAIDKTWMACDREMPGWTTTDFDDRAWETARELVKSGEGPWGELDGEHGLTMSPVASNPFVGSFNLPANSLADDLRVCVEAEKLAPEGAAAIALNGQDVGGFIGKPYRLDITARVHPGENRIVLQPFAPRRVSIVVYPRAAATGSRQD